MAMHRPLLTILLCRSIWCIPNVLAEHQQLYSSTHGSSSYYLDMAIIAVSLLLIIAEVIVLRSSRRQQSLVAFNAYDKQLEDHPSHSASNSDISVAKNEAIHEEQPSKEDSPGIKVIKGMTANTEDDAQEDSRESKRKRKRKADKLSERRPRGE